MHTNFYIIAYLVIGAGFHFGSTFPKTWTWYIPIRWAITVALWPGAALGRFIDAIRYSK